MRNAVREQGAGESAEQPARTGEAVPGQTQARAQGGGEAIAHVVLAVAGHCEIDGDHQHPVAGVGDAPDERVDALRSARHVGLEPAARRGLGNVLHADQRRAGENHRDVGGLCGARQDEVAAVGGECAQPHRRDGKGGVPGFAEEFDRLRALGHVNQHARAEGVVGKGIAVGRERGVALGGAGHVAEQRTGQEGAGGGLEIVE